MLSIADDVFGAGAEELGEVRLRGGDALLAELERARTGVMLDIVATIQLEQDEVIRAPLPGVLTVQGGPGHRARPRSASTAPPTCSTTTRSSRAPR